MVDTLARVTTLLFAVAILLIGHGLQLTLLPLHALAAGWSSTQIGLSGSCYFLGFAAGCILVPGAVARVGHIRSFMVMAAIATVVVLAAGLLVNFWAWLLFRFANGMAMAGLYMIVESWLTDVCPRDRRGTILAIYLAVSLVGMAIGQLLLLWSTPAESGLFMLAAILLSAAIVPIGLTQISSPKPIPVVRVTPGTLLRASRVAVICAFIAGLVTGSFWTLGPVVARSFGLDAGQAGIMMSIGVIGGALLQYPMGRLSDLMDRRLVIGGLAVSGFGVGFFGGMFAGSSVPVLYATMFLLCGTAMPLYALCIALAADETDLTLVELTTGMLLAHGVGSILGPIIVSPQMTLVSSRMFFFFCATCLGAAATWTFYRCFVVEREVVRDAHRPMLPRTTQAVAVLLDEES